VVFVTVGTETLRAQSSKSIRSRRRIPPVLVQEGRPDPTRLLTFMPNRWHAVTKRMTCAASDS